MADLTEQEYKRTAVTDFLTDMCGAENVIREPTNRLASDRVPDFVVTTPFHVLYVEVENDAEGTIHGAGQAVEYAGEARYTREEQALPVVIAPSWEYPERDALREFVTVVTVPADYERGDLQP